MLVAVLMVFVIFSFTGVAVLNISYLSSSSSQETINNIKLQYAVESTINEALWRINVGVDSLVNFDSDGITTVWDSTTQILSVNVDKFQMESEILLDLSEDTHFDRGLAAEETIILDPLDPGPSADFKPREHFNFMPDVDLQYFLDNAVATHTASFQTWRDGTFADGIHVFTGNYITIQDMTLLSGTLIFTGHHVNFMYDNYLVAPPADTTAANPVLIFTNPNQSFELYSQHHGETILGAIYCKKKVTLRNGTISGPVIAKNIRTYGNAYHFLDQDNVQNYKWTRGFGNRDSYDWPKQIGRWRIHKWINKHVNA